MEPDTRKPGVYFATSADGSSACGSAHFIVRAPASTILTLNYSGSAIRCDLAKKRTLPHPGTVLFFCTNEKILLQPKSEQDSCGGDDRDRTDYLLNAIQALSQVSYTPTGDTRIKCFIIIPNLPLFVKGHFRFFKKFTGCALFSTIFSKY